jgi:hypothetical protein
MDEMKGKVLGEVTFLKSSRKVRHGLNLSSEWKAIRQMMQGS